MVCVGEGAKGGREGHRCMSWAMPGDGARRVPCSFRSQPQMQACSEVQTRMRHAAAHRPTGGSHHLPWSTPLAPTSMPSSRKATSSCRCLRLQLGWSRAAR